MSDDLKPEDDKVQAINKMPQQINVRDHQCFLGMDNYLNTYSSTLVGFGDSFRQLTEKKAPFV